jgi:phosphatidylglycerol:prolipoprotein diacylglycerol transferase
VTFPVYIHVGQWSFHPHRVFELMGYGAGGALFLWLRRQYGDSVGRDARWSVAAAAIVGGVVGSRLLDAIADPGGKTIVGGLIGGLIAVEWVKRRMGITAATGDLFAIPLAVGIAIGRIGCFLTGLSDHTYGNATTLWTGVDFGDGIRRHPAQLYEIAFLIVLTAVLVRARGRLAKAGDEFRLFMVAYMGFRLGVDFLKPANVVVTGLSPIQWACVAMLVWYLVQARRAGPGEGVSGR